MFFENIEKGINNYPDFNSMHSILTSPKNKKLGFEVMHKYFTHIKTNLLSVLKNDKSIKHNIFNESLTEEAYVNMIFLIIMSKLMKKDYNSKPLIELIKISIY